jgi:hypothetical protein
MRVGRITELRGQGAADRACGSFADLLDNIKRVDADEARIESVLPLWEVHVAEGAFVRRTVRRSWSAAMLLETIAAELMRDEDARDEALMQVSVTIGRAK